MPSTTVNKRFHDSYITEPNSGCWLWTNATTNGYGVMQIGTWKHQKLRMAHRVSVELSTGVSLRQSDVVCHKCDTPACVNPDHLFVGSHADNVRDKVANGRHPKGDVHYRTILTRDILASASARIAAGESGRKVARDLGVSPDTVSSALRRGRYS